MNENQIIYKTSQVDKLSMVGVNGKKFPAIREHLQENIAGVYKDMDLSFDGFPAEDSVDPLACACATSLAQDTL